MNADVKKKIVDAAELELGDHCFPFVRGAEFGFKLCQEQAEQILVKALRDIEHRPVLEKYIQVNRTDAFAALQFWAKLMEDK